MQFSRVNLGWLVVGVALAFASSAGADNLQSNQSASRSADVVVSNWVVDDKASEVTFVSTKAGDIAEAHSIGQITGSLSVTGKGQRQESVQQESVNEAELNVKLHLASVDTSIAVRDERMREHLFDVAKFPTADVHGHLPVDEYLNLAIGDSAQSSMSLMLDVRGVRIPVSVDTLVLRLAEDRMMVTSVRPVIINAASLNLVAGIEKLRELAGLPSISKAVPVSFVLTLVR